VARRARRFLGCLRAGFHARDRRLHAARSGIAHTPLTEFRPAPKGVAMLNFFGFGGNDGLAPDRAMIKEGTLAQK